MNDTRVVREAAADAAAQRDLAVRVTVTGPDGVHPVGRPEGRQALRRAGADLARRERGWHAGWHAALRHLPKAPAAAAIVRALEDVPLAAAAAVADHLADAAAHGADVDPADLAALLDDNTVVDDPQALADRIVALYAAAGVADLHALTRLRAVVDLLAVEPVADLDALDPGDAPPLPLADVHDLAEPAAANAPPARDLPTPREVALI